MGISMWQSVKKAVRCKADMPELVKIGLCIVVVSVVFLLCCKWVKIAAADFASAVPEPAVQHVTGELPNGEKFKINCLRGEDWVVSVIPSGEKGKDKSRIEIRNTNVRGKLYRRLVYCGLSGLLLLYLIVVVSLLRLINKCVLMANWKKNWDVLETELSELDEADRKKIRRQWQEAKRRICIGGD